MLSFFWGLTFRFIQSFYGSNLPCFFNQQIGKCQVHTSTVETQAASAQCFTPNQLQKTQHAPPTGWMPSTLPNFQGRTYENKQTDGLSIQKWSWDTWSGNQKYINRGKLIKYHSATPGRLVPRCFCCEKTSGVSAISSPTSIRQTSCASEISGTNSECIIFRGVLVGLCQDCVQHMSESNQGRLAKYERQHPCQTTKKFYDNWSFVIALGKMCVIMCVCVHAEFRVSILSSWWFLPM